jgi:hypothetical protein
MRPELPAARTLRVGARASPESVARAILEGVEDGDEEIFPDPMSAPTAESWRTGPVKALERETRHS